MAIIATMRTPQYSWGEYHRINGGMILCGADEAAPKIKLRVDMHHHQSTRAGGFLPLTTHVLEIPLTELPGLVSSIYEKAMQTEFFTSIGGTSDEPQEGT